jgi:MOSC domain-containing protein YiiM
LHLQYLYGKGLTRVLIVGRWRRAKRRAGGVTEGQITSSPVIISGMRHVEHIHIAPAEGAPTQSVDEIEAVMGVGLIGDRYADHSGHWDDSKVGRELTLVEAEALEMLGRDHGIELQAGETRRNLTTRGVQLNDLVGKTFRVGDVLMKGTELCEPCQYLTDLLGKPIHRPLAHRAGLRVQLLSSGMIRTGDAIERVAEKALSS